MRLRIMADDRRLSGQEDRAIRERRACQGILWLFPASRSSVRSLGAANSLRDLAALLGNRLETLKGPRQGQYSIRINDQWRICFEWPEGSPGPVNVEIVDYH
jgi:plasmid maintenance system killer protein